jgi:EmrB/QacA subfamily drug resistance transporter
MSPDPGLALASPGGRVLVATTVLGSAVAMLMATVVNVALPALARALDADSADQQWIVNAYLLPLAALVLVGGALGDRFGRRRVFRIGVALFAAASVACALAPDVSTLILCRAGQGIGAALLAPGSLAILQASVRPEDRGRAIGLWSGLGGIAAAVGPLVGGLLVEASWRWVFGLPVALAAGVLVLTRWIPESRDPAGAHAKPDPAGAALAVVGLGGLSYGLIQGSPAALGVAAFALVALWGVERRLAHAMIPLDLFADRAFVGANLVTLLVYAGLGVVFLLLSVQLQVGAGWSPVAAGGALLPVTLVMLALSARAGELAQRIGPRWPLTVGPLIMAAGMLLLVRVDADATFLGDVLPANLVFGLGLAASVAPVTATALGSVPPERSGAASGTNNAVARTGQLLAVAAIPPAVGLSGDALSDPVALGARFPAAIVVSAALVALGGVAGFALLRRGDLEADRQPTPKLQCPVDAPPPSPTRVGSD